MNKWIALLLCVAMTLTLFCGCAPVNLGRLGTTEPEDDGITIPDLAGTDVDSAKTILVGKGLIPVVNEVEDETVKEGMVIRTEPAAGEKADNESSVTVFVSTGAPLKVPDVIKKSEEAAINELKELGLQWTVKYEHHDKIEAGKVFRTGPAPGSVVEKGRTVSLYVSTGPEWVQSKSSYLTWYHMGDGQDEWEFYAPSKDDDYLYLTCHTVTIHKTFEWQDRYEEGFGLGKACLNDTFDKTVPIEVIYDNVKVKNGEPFSITIRIPLSELDTEFPTDLYMELFTVKKHTDTNTTPLKLELSVTW